MNSLSLYLIRDGIISPDALVENPEHKMDVGPCRKRPHPDAASAQQHLDRLLADPHCIRPETLVVYKCWNCRLWHAGHDDRAKVEIPNQHRTIGKDGQSHG